MTLLVMRWRESRLDNAGSSMDAKMAMMAMTTSNSIKVKDFRIGFSCFVGTGKTRKNILGVSIGFFWGEIKRLM